MENNNHHITVEEIINEIVSSLTFPLFKNLKKQYDGDLLWSNFYSKRQNLREEIKETIEGKLNYIINRLDKFDEFLNEKKYVSCEDILSEVLDAYQGIIKQIKTKAEALGLFKENLEDVVGKIEKSSLVQNLFSYKEQLFLERFRSLRDYAEKYIQIVKSGKTPKHSPLKVAKYIEKVLENYVEFSSEALYKEVEELYEEIKDLPIEVKIEVVEEKPKRKIKKRKEG